MYYKIIKKFYKILIISLLVFSLIFISIVRVCAITEEDIGEISAPAALLMEPSTGTVIFEKNPHEVRCCASITKVMTVILVMEAIDSGKIKLSDIVTASAHAASKRGSHIWLKEGEKMTVDELLKATLVASANDGAVALAEYVAGTEEAFVTQMNQKAQSLGMSDTVFKNCNGLDDNEDGHVTSAYDVALMSRELTKHKKVFDYTSIWIDYLRDGQTQLVNTNKLLKSYKGITGLKTGTTSKAGACISATATRGNLSLIAVVLGAENGKARFKEAATLLDFGFASYNMLEPVIDESIFEPVKVINGMKPYVDITACINNKILIKKGKEKSITNSIEITSEIQAPIKKGQSLGRLIYKLDDNVISEYDVTACENVEKISFGLVFKELLSCFFKV